MFIECLVYNNTGSYTFSKINNYDKTYLEDNTFDYSTIKLSAYSTVYKSVSEIDVKLIKNVNNLISSDVKYLNNEEFSLSNLPLVGNSYLNSLENYMEIINIVKSYDSLFELLLDRLENTSISIKFF